VILTIIVDQVLHVVKDHKQSIKLRRWETLIQTYKGYPLKKYKFKDLDLFNLTWEQGRQVLLAYDPRSQTFGFTYAAPGADGGNQNISLFYGYSSIIADFIDGSLGSDRPS
jgi:hypothetical protein